VEKDHNLKTAQDRVTPLLWVDSAAIINTIQYNLAHISTKQRLRIPSEGSTKDLLLWLSLITGNITVDKNGGYLHQPCIDRTSSCPMPFNFDVSRFQMPALKHISKSFSEICSERVMEIKKISEIHNKQILIMYSGGVDSTCIVCSFILTLGAEFVQRHVTLMLNSDSIEENPRFYEDFIRGKITTITSNDYNTSLQPDKYITVNGDPGGALEGGGVLRTILVDYNDTIDTPNWKDQISKYHSKLFVSSLYTRQDINYVDHFIECIEVSAQTQQLQITNLFDCFWWYLINFKWMAMSLNMYKNCGGMLLTHNHGIDYWFDHMIPFFSTDDFTLWSFSNKQYMLDIRKTMLWPAYYKRAFKEVIYQVNQDEEYLNNKGKDARLRRAMNPRTKQNIFALNNNMTPII